MTSTKTHKEIHNRLEHSEQSTLPYLNGERSGRKKQLANEKVRGSKVWKAFNANKKTRTLSSVQ